MLDTRVFDPVETQLSSADKISILAIQECVARQLGSYAYFEIGSHVGGSLQPHLMDPRCVAVYSVDPRPPRQPDERGEFFKYPDNTTERMLETLRPHYSDQLSKLRCFECDARDVPAEQLDISPSLSFVDGEHTDAAVLSDFTSCLRLSRRPCVVVFDDVHIIYRGFQRCIAETRASGMASRAYVLPDKIGVMEIGGPDLYRERSILELLASPDAYLFATEALDHYRRIVMQIKDIPGVRMVRYMRNLIFRRRGGMGGTGRSG